MYFKIWNRFVQTVVNRYFNHPISTTFKKHGNSTRKASSKLTSIPLEFKLYWLPVALNRWGSQSSDSMLFAVQMHQGLLSTGILLMILILYISHISSRFRWYKIIKTTINKGWILHTYCQYETLSLVRILKNNFRDNTRCGCKYILSVSLRIQFGETKCVIYGNISPIINEYTTSPHLLKLQK